MALINCPECGKEISDKALSCPNCGNPMNQTIDVIQPKNEELLKFPELPANLEIGKQIVNWGGNAAFDGEYRQNENVVTEIPSGKVKVILHTHGLQVVKGLTFYPIHNSQIISIKQTSRDELIRTDKSVIGRAVVGGLVLGPLGAIVGGMSGIGSKEKLKNKNYLVINFWDKETKAAQTILVSGDKTLISAFIKRHEKEKTINKTENRAPEKDKMPVWGIIAIIVIIVSVLVIIFS
ncbi:MAG: zinc-ribbon domain-containing protein [Bacteroidales bacterium]|nr:zinc-ribbon domain-containing protein [Bacteroidales bacterium]